MAPVGSAGSSLSACRNCAGSNQAALEVEVLPFESAHLALAEAAANPLILSLIDSIVAVLREQRMRIFKVEGGPERGQYHHKKILEAVEQSDPEGAREAMRAHLRQVSEDSQSGKSSRNRSE